MGEQKCASCRFWQPSEPSGVAPGECRRRAPAKPTLYAPTWTSTKSDDWCGEHEPREGSSQ